MRPNLLILLLVISMAFAKNLSSKINSQEIHYAVLVAGSNGFWNYRHQSDIFHAYHLLKENGVPEENIIVFAYDDIANGSQNPFKGKVFNKPDPKGPGKDVYEGVKIDYKGKDVTPQNFLAVLEGNQEKLAKVGTGRVLKSTETDNVFVYFSDHGATGLIAFPSSELYADQLIKTLNKMHSENRYKEFVFYLEACESGSMFNKILPADINVYATTAANPSQSSWATYCNPDDKINGKSVGSCLGDEYSVVWMEDTEADKGLTKTLQKQWEDVRDGTLKSEVHQYGTLDYTHKDIGQYQGNHIVEEVTVYGRVIKHLKSFRRIVKKYIRTILGKKSRREVQRDYLREAKKSAIDSRDVKLQYLLQKASTSNDSNDWVTYKQELAHIQRTDGIFNVFHEQFGIEEGTVVNDIDFDCLRSGVETYKEVCANWGEYDLKYVRSIALACERNVTVEDIRVVFGKICMM